MICDHFPASTILRAIAAMRAVDTLEFIFASSAERALVMNNLASARNELEVELGAVEIEIEMEVA